MINASVFSSKKYSAKSVEANLIKFLSNQKIFSQFFKKNYKAFYDFMQ